MSLHEARSWGHWLRPLNILRILSRRGRRSHSKPQTWQITLWEARPRGDLWEARPRGDMAEGHKNVVAGSPLRAHWLRSLNILRILSRRGRRPHSKPQARQITLWEARPRGGWPPGHQDVIARSPLLGPLVEAIKYPSDIIAPGSTLPQQTPDPANNPVGGATSGRFVGGPTSGRVGRKAIKMLLHEARSGLTGSGH